ncbi:hypothetical protein [Halobacteriovorax marinus]|uniref:hypothetical protein n=1 Tax=Halobacteriovorax marinus TaxID=97084 RepID=UPI003A940073
MKYLFLALLVSSFSASASANSDLRDHILGGYQSGMKMVETETGKVTKNGLYICDYKGVTETTLLKMEQGHYTFHIKEESNVGCENRVDERILYTTFDYLSIGVNKFFQDYIDDGLNPKFDTQTKVLEVTFKGKKYTNDLADATTLEAMNAKLTNGGKSTTGDLVTVHGEIKYEEILNASAPTISQDIRICDTALDSDPYDGITLDEEICR